MKLRNKKTGDIVEFSAVLLVKDGKNGEQPAHLEYPSLEAAMEEWEVDEEPKDFWFVDADGEVKETNYLSDNDKSSLRSFGNYFSSREEAELAVRKLKAWKRLKDKGFRFRDWDTSHHNLGTIEFFLPDVVNDVDEYRKDLDLLFSGEDD